MSEKFNFWRVLPDAASKSGNVIAQCDCGTVKEVSLWNLKSGNSKSCGCQPRSSKNYVGQVFGRLTCLAQPIRVGKTRKVLAQCVCGVVKDYDLPSIVSGGTKSCGCYKKEVSSTHGLAGSKTYKAWASVIDRTSNPNNIAYRHYGGRGITMSEDWKKFENFYRDMGESPAGTSLDREDNDGNYCKDNCRWATKIEQSRNKERQGSKKLGVTSNGKGGWTAQMGIKLPDGKKYSKYFGTFKTYEEAVVARIAAENLYWKTNAD